MTQWICPVDKKRKPELLYQLINDYQWQQMIVFMRTKHSANKLTRFLEGKGLKAAAIHGNKSQAARTKALTGFKNGQVDILVATDIAARGLDIDQLPQVVNFDLPQVAEDYVHRIGRTGRAGATGQAVSLVSADEFEMLTEIERLLKKRLERKLIDGFEPLHDLPTSKTDEELKASRPARNSRPKKTSGIHKNNKPPRSRRAHTNKPRKSGNQTKPGNRRPTGNRKTPSTSNREINGNR